MDIGEGEPLFGNFEYEDLFVAQPIPIGSCMAYLLTFTIKIKVNISYMDPMGHNNHTWESCELWRLGHLEPQLTTDVRTFREGKCSKIQPTKAVSFLVEQRQMGLDLSWLIRSGFLHHFKQLIGKV